MNQLTSPRMLFDRLIQGQRVALAKAITLVESSAPSHHAQAQSLLQNLLIHRQKQYPNTFRIGLSGAPGVGKSSFIESFGMHLIDQGHRVAVLAVDPSSTITGGSILGDKTRMPELSKNLNAFVRPSPSRGTLGGVARNTNDAILLCEAAGYDITLVETVGVGQSETMVSQMVDMFVLLVAPGSGDELQGMKKGIVELSDLIIVNKSDGILEAPAKMAQSEYLSATKFIQPTLDLWKVPVLRCSSHQKTGIDEIWRNIQSYRKLLIEQQLFERKRGTQQINWMWQRITDEILYRLKTDTKIRHTISKLEKLVYCGEITSGQASDKIIEQFIHPTFITKT